MSNLSILVLALFVGAGISLYDLRSDERHTVVVYTTPALRDLLEKDIVPRFERAHDVEVSLSYVPAGQQYNRLRMGGDAAEADLFLHASPLYLEKGYSDGYVDPANFLPAGSRPALMARPVEGGRAWHAFAWSPLVEVYPEGTGDAPDLLASEAAFGFPHPLLSNNGIYAVLFFEDASPEAGQRALAHTRVQPTNARANIGGVGDGSFALTLGYEAVVRFYQTQGAKISYAAPRLGDERVTTPALFAVSLIHGHRHPSAQAFLEFLFTNETQDALGAFHFRSIRENAPTQGDLIDLADVRTIDHDWSKWAELEAALPNYMVRS